MDLKLRTLSLIVIGAIVSLFMIVRITSNPESPYAPISSFVGCYSGGTNRMMLGAKGELKVNGTSAGAYRILKPVGGKHGFLVEADGLKLTGGRGTPVRAARGDDGFFWPINGETLDILFAPDVALIFRKSALRFC